MKEFELSKAEYFGNDNSVTKNNSSSSKHKVSGFSNVPHSDLNAKTKKPLIIFYLILVILHTVLQYVIKPVGVFLEIVFLTSLVKIKANDSDVNVSSSVSGSLDAIGWLILFLLPLYHFFTLGIKIVTIQRDFFGRLYIGIINLIEIIFNLPLTFMYTSNLYSVYLYDEKGVKQLLSPWLVFFPTEYNLSVFEILRNFIDAGFFTVSGNIKYNEIKDNQYQAFSIVVLQLMIAFCVMRFIGNFFLLIIKIKTGLKKNKPKSKE
jgi:hypothetical protein